MPKDTTAKTATLYRMLMTDRTCPHGLKSKDLLERQGFQVDDRHLTSRGEVEAFKLENDVQTTPQTFIGSERIGGFDDLNAHSGKPPSPKMPQPISLSSLCSPPRHYWPSSSLGWR